MYIVLFDIHTRLYFATLLQYDHQNTMHVCLTRGCLGWEECNNSPWKLRPPISWRRKTAMTVRLIIPSLDIANFEMKLRLFFVCFFYSERKGRQEKQPLLLTKISTTKHLLISFLFPVAALQHSMIGILKYVLHNIFSSRVGFQFYL